MTRRISVFGIPFHEAEEWHAQGWIIEVWRWHPHRHYSLMVWREERG